MQNFMSRSHQFNLLTNRKLANKSKSLNLRLLSLSLCGLTSSLAIATPTAHANRLETFVYDLTDSRIEFSVKNDIEPRGTVISNPTRIVINAFRDSLLRAIRVGCQRAFDEYAIHH